MFQHLLVPLDGSQRAEQALPVAVQLARASSGTITLLHVVDQAHVYNAIGGGVPYLTQDAIDANLAEAQRYLDRLIQGYHLAQIPIEKQVLLGNPAAVILEVAEKQEADFIVMSSHGYTGLQRWLLGSAAEKVARHSPVPVLVLREDKPLFPQLQPDRTGVIRALVPLDASPRSQEALLPAAALVSALASPGRGALHLVQVVIQLEGMWESEKANLLQAARQNLATIEQHMREKLATTGGLGPSLDLTWSVSVDTDIAEGIVRIAEQGEGRAKIATCDLIAMTTHGYTGLQKWAMGSITERVLHATPLPLLIVRPADMIEKERRHKKHQGTVAG